MFGRSKHGWIGLDIGASCIKLAQVVRVGDRLHLQDAAVVPRSSPWRDDDVLAASPVSAADEIASALLTAPQACGRQSAALVPTTACQFNTAPLVETSVASQVSAIVDELATVGVSLSGRVFDYWPGLATKSGPSGVHVLSTSRRWSESTTADMDHAGLFCQAIDGLPQALARAVGYVHTDPSKTQAALDWSYTGATFVLIEQGAPVYVRQLRHCGLADMLDTVGEQLNLSSDEASELLQTVNLSPRGGEAGDEVSQAVAELLEPKLDHLVDELQRTLEHLRNIGRSMKPNPLSLEPQVLYLFGGGATVGGIDSLLSHRLQQQVRTWKLSDDAEAKARVKAAPLCLLGPAIALSALRWEGK
jgi:Tfp pilus assembly PilM family ATPase